MQLDLQTCFADSSEVSVLVLPLLRWDVDTGIFRGTQHTKQVKQVILNVNNVDSISHIFLPIAGVDVS